jgi:hypothetical protein
MAQQAASHITITTLPTDMLSCIVRLIQTEDLHLDRQLDDVAALRSTYRSLRNAVDVSVTCATIHSNMIFVELRSTVRRCDGEWTCCC